MGYQRRVHGESVEACRPRYEASWRPQAGPSPRGRVSGRFPKFAGTPACFWEADKLIWRLRTLHISRKYSSRRGKQGKRDKRFDESCLFRKQDWRYSLLNILVLQGGGVKQKQGGNIAFQSYSFYPFYFICRIEYCLPHLRYHIHF